MLSARVRRDDGGFGPEFDHMLLKVQLDEPWLVDVGFGDSFVDPIVFHAGGADQVNGHRYSRLVRAAMNGSSFVKMKRARSRCTLSATYHVLSATTPGCAISTRPRRNPVLRNTGSAAKRRRMAA